METTQEATPEAAQEAPDPVMNRNSRMRGRIPNLDKLDDAGRDLFAATATALREANDAYRKIWSRWELRAITKTELLDAEEKVFNAITAFRKAHGTWVQVATAMGVTSQSAQVWYKRRLPK